MVLSIISALPLPHHHLPTRSSTSKRRARTHAANDMDVDHSSSSSSSSTSDDEQDDADLGIGSSKTVITTPGEPISTAKEFMRGHGTYLSTLGGGGGEPDAYDDVDEEGKMVDAEGEGEMWVMGSVAGVVERVNKLVSVRSMKGRYIPAVGDLLIGRITDVRQSTWKVDCAARLEGTLGLGSVNLPGGVLRRKLESDVLRMRELLKEGDLLVAEVQGLKGDGGMELHTRSLRYGKLRNGLLLTISPHLIRRLKSHFITLPGVPLPSFPSSSNSQSQHASKTQQGSPVDIILGVNGYVWVMGSTGVGEDERRVMGFQGGSGGGKDGEGEEGEGLRMYSDENDDIPPLTRLSISLTSQLILLFAKYSIPLTDVLLTEGQRWCVALGWGAAGAGANGGSAGGMSEEMERRVVAGVCGVGEGEVELV